MALPHIRCLEDSEISVSLYTMKYSSADIQGAFQIIEAIKWFTWELNQALAEERIFMLQIIGNLCKHLSVYILYSR